MTKRLARTATCLLLVTVGCGGEATRPSGSEDLTSNPSLQAVVAQTLARDGAALLSTLAEGNAAERRRAVMGLAAVADPANAPALLGALQDVDVGVRAAAAFALGRLRQPALAGPLLSALVSERNQDTRHRIIEALGKSGGEAALEGLVAVPADTDDEAAIALALGRMALENNGTSASFDRLVRGLTHADAIVRQRAAWYFGRVALSSPWAAFADPVREAVDGYDPDDPAAISLVAAVSRLGDGEDTPRLLFWLTEGGDWRVRHAAATALTTRVDDPRVTDALFGAIDDASPHVGVAAATAVSTLARPTPEQLTRMRTWVEANPSDRHRVFPLLAAFTTRDDPSLARAWLAGLPAEDEAARARGWAALAMQPGLTGLEAAMEAVALGGLPSLRALESIEQRWAGDRSDPAAVSLVFEGLTKALRSGAPAEVFTAARILSDPAFQPLGSVELLREVAAPLDPVASAIQLSGLRGVLELLGGEVGDLPEPELPRRGPVDWDALARWGPSPTLTLATEVGRVVVRLDPSQAPQTVATLLELADSGRLDGTPFHRVVPGFVAQGGDVSGAMGLGGPGYQIRTEPTLIPFERGVIGMASAGPDTEGSQFFIMQGFAPHLDGDYTAFGRVTEGLDVVDLIQEGALLQGAGAAR